MRPEDDERIARQRRQEQMDDDFFYFMMDEELSRGNPQTPRSRPRRPGEISTGAAILSVIGGLVAVGVLFTLLNIDVDDVSVVLILILWFVLRLLISNLFRR